MLYKLNVYHLVLQVFTASPRRPGWSLEVASASHAISSPKILSSRSRPSSGTRERKENPYTREFLPSFRTRLGPFLIAAIFVGVYTLEGSFGRRQRRYFWPSITKRGENHAFSFSPHCGRPFFCSPLPPLVTRKPSKIYGPEEGCRPFFLGLRQSEAFLHLLYIPKGRGEVPGLYWATSGHAISRVVVLLVVLMWCTWEEEKWKCTLHHLGDAIAFISAFLISYCTPYSGKNLVENVLVFSKLKSHLFSTFAQWSWNLAPLLYS